MDEDLKGKKMEYDYDVETSGGGMKKTIIWVLLIVVVLAVVVVTYVTRKSGADEEEYIALIDRANTALAMEQLMEAKRNYMAAQIIKPDERLPRDKITLIDSLLALGETVPADTSMESIETEELEPEQGEKLVTEGEQAAPEGMKAEKSPPPHPSKKTGAEEKEWESPHTFSYHIVVGSFSVKSNAVNYSEKLKAKGIDSKVIPIHDGKMNVVTYGSFKTEEEARRELRKVQAEFNKDAWVLKK